MERPIRIIVKLLVSLWLLSMAALAHANFVSEFDITFTSGNLIGDTYTGTIVTDSGADGVYNPDGSAGGGLLISFDISIDGHAFTAMSDDLHPLRPVVHLTSSVVTDLLFMTSVDYPRFAIDYQLDNHNLGACRV